ncbi:RhoGAP-domain-containing protein [Mycena alexandri]|uniref:RhoGAP-domain-containing protein n=1 Tax=Mycena alexandri TaxID=1745969 RepID=A0AAD6TJP0_9AGAR|nr:RhoGAP-domain-containing protein [Mycena alexandri]
MSSAGRPGVTSATSSLSSSSSAAFSASLTDSSQSDSDHAAATLHQPAEKLAAAALPSSSFAHDMGQNESKSSLAPPSSPKSFYVAASTGSKLKRAFAARRKKSEDIGAGGDSQSSSRQKSARQLTMQVAHAFSGKKGKEGPSPPPKPVSMQGTKRSQPPPPPIQSTSLTPANRGSIIPITPGVSSAVNFMIKQERELSGLPPLPPMPEIYREQLPPMPEIQREQDGDKNDSKEDWRRSDATITQRPGATAGARASRPVSTADSLQSTHTVVPVSRRLSALITDTDFGMAEEDEDRNASNHPVSPAASVRSTKPRSMSLNVGPSQPFVQSNAPVSPKLSTETAPPMAPSTPRETPTLTRAAAAGIISPSSSGLQSTGNNIRGRLAAWTATNNSTQSASVPRPEQPVPVPAPRQQAISISAGFAPAAGLAKRAVEKMGRWGGFSSSSSNSGYSSSSSSTAPSSYSSVDNGLVRTNSNSGPSGKVPKHRRTPNSASSAWSINSSNHSSSISDVDAFAPPPGPILGKRLRGPLKVTNTGANAGSVVFGGRLKVVVSETAVTVGGRRGRDIEDLGTQRTAGLPLLKLLEHRMLPALVVRCAQHLLIWGVQEEGLFRVTGRPSHISKLRSEFDTGADYDMTECTPGDLDPHAVSSVFKAFLRELPEPILTQGLIPYFEAALAQETSINEQDKTPRVKGPIGPGLPSGPRSGQAMRKPPSLSTLAMPNFTSIRPPSKSLLSALKSLIGQLPPENRDLIRTVTELIRATAKQSKETKMPLSNLLLVFCPSLNMNPPLLRVLCEAEGIWGDEEPVELPSAVIDIKRDSVLDIRAPDTAKPSDNPVTDPLPSPTRPRSPGARNQRMHPTAVYVDNDDSSEVSSLSQMLAEDATHDPPRSDDVSSVSTCEDVSIEPRLDAPSPLLSSSAESLATPSSGPSLTHIPLEGKDLDAKPSLVIADSPDHSPDPQLNGPARRPTISAPLTSPIQFPTMSGNSPGTPLSSTRPIPTLSLPSLSLSGFSSKSDNNSSGSAPSSPLRRLKKPSLQLLFSKRSASPLTPSRGAFSAITGPYLQHSKAASDSSLSTPVSAVTAPQSSSSHLPPLLDTPIESSRFHMSLGINLESPDLSPGDKQPSADVQVPESEPEPPLPVLGQTPIADWYRAPPSSTLAVNHLRPQPGRKVSQASIASTASSNRLGVLPADENEEDWTQSVLLAADLDWTKQGK